MVKPFFHFLCCFWGEDNRQVGMCGVTYSQNKRTFWLFRFYWGNLLWGCTGYISCTYIIHLLWLCGLIWLIVAIEAKSVDENCVLPKSKRFCNLKMFFSSFWLIMVLVFCRVSICTNNCVIITIATNQVINHTILWAISFSSQNIRIFQHDLVAPRCS